jgi:hypothetical protein
MMAQLSEAFRRYAGMKIVCCEKLFSNFGHLTPCFFGKRSWYFGPMPVIGVRVKK